MPRGKLSFDILEGGLWLALQRSRKHLSGVLMDGEELAYKCANSMGVSERHPSCIPRKEVYGKGEAIDRACCGLRPRCNDPIQMGFFKICFY